MSYNKTSNRKLPEMFCVFTGIIFPRTFSHNTSSTLRQNCLHMNRIKKLTQIKVIKLKQRHKIRKAEKNKGMKRKRTNRAGNP
jgi:hypothetical protein